MAILAGDIGGTNSRLAIITDLENREISFEKKYPSKEHQSLTQIVTQFLSEAKQEVQCACFGVAGPVRNGVCKATNLPWVVDANELAKTTGIEHIWLINDLEANAEGILSLKSEELIALREAEKEPYGNRALISAGTGLGEAGIFFDGTKYHPIPSEGGHSDLPSRNAFEWELYCFLQEKFKGRVSWERVLSGRGLQSIYEFLVSSGKVEEIKLKCDLLTPSEVTKGALDGCPTCTRVLEIFSSYYGSEAGNLALKFMATGGVYLGGGIAPKVLPFLQQDIFLRSFSEKGRFSDLLAKIPIYVIMNDRCALLGAAKYAWERV